MFVYQMMTADPITVRPETAATKAAEIMKENKFRRLPVIENGKLAGIITDRDLREVQPSPATTLSVYELNYLLAKIRVGEIMKTNVVTVSDKATIEEAALLMYTHKIGGLVVIDAAGSVVGILTETDIFRCFVDIMGLKEGRLRLTLEFDDRVGVLHQISKVFHDLGISIISMASQHLANGKVEMVIRADCQDSEELIRQMADAGFPVSHLVQIGA